MFIGCQLTCPPLFYVHVFSAVTVRSYDMTLRVSYQIRTSARLVSCDFRVNSVLYARFILVENSQHSCTSSYHRIFNYSLLEIWRPYLSKLYVRLKLAVIYLSDVTCLQTLVRWLLAVRKNYRTVAYHNWRHAFNVCQSMFAVLQVVTGRIFNVQLAVSNLFCNFDKTAIRYCSIGAALSLAKRDKFLFCHHHHHHHQQQQQQQHHWLKH